MSEFTFKVCDKVVASKKHNLGKYPIRGTDGGRVYICVRDKEVLGPKEGEFGNHQLPVILTEDSEFVRTLKVIESRCKRHLEINGDVAPEKVLRCFTEEGESPMLYVPIDEWSLVCRESDKDKPVKIKSWKGERPTAHVCIELLGIILPDGKDPSVKIRLHEVMILDITGPKIKRHFR